MLHKKRKPSTFTSSSGFAGCKRNAASNNNMLHSKSTYFYRWLGSLKSGKLGSQSDHNFANEFRWSSPHCEQSGASSDAFYANRTRSSRATNSCSKTTGRTGTYLVPTMCSVALLLGLGIIFNPVMGKTDKASATTVTANPTGYSSISLTISNNGTEINDGSTVSTNVEPGLVNYITNNLKIDTKKINRFYITVQAASNGTSELTGTNNHATIAPVGANKKPADFGDNTWGFALGEANTANESLSYNSLPVYNAATTPQYSSATNLADGTYNLKLTFAAKINANKPNDHYTTKAMVSVAADAAKLTWDTIERMQDMTSEICGQAGTNGWPTTKQLVDDRTASGIADQKTYWVSKLKDGKCWMTQNLDLPLKQGDILKPDDTDVTANYTVPALGNYRDPGMINYKVSAASGNFASSSCGDPAGSGCSAYFETYTGSVDGDTTAHYLIGNYYPWTIAMAGKTAENQGSICPKGWKLPTQTEYGTITGLGNSAAGANAVRKDPYYFPAAGYYLSGWGSVAGEGDYWPSTPNSSSAYYLHFASSNLNMYDNAKSLGFPVRCVAK